MGVKRIDREFDERLKQLYEIAIQKGLLKDTYAALRHEDYCAEGVQSWCGANRQNGHGHNRINTRQELESYDPNLAELIAEVFHHSFCTD